MEKLLGDFQRLNISTDSYKTIESSKLDIQYRLTEKSSEPTNSGTRILQVQHNGKLHVHNYTGSFENL